MAIIKFLYAAITIFLFSKIVKIFSSDIHNHHVKMAEGTSSQWS